MSREKNLQADLRRIHSDQVLLTIDIPGQSYYYVFSHFHGRLILQLDM